MANKIILLSGPSSSGKSVLTKALSGRYHCAPFSTEELLVKDSPQISKSSLSLDEEILRIDKRTGGKWIIDELVKKTASLPQDALVVVDAVTSLKQVGLIRRAYGSRVIHIHLDASDSALVDRQPSQAKSQRGNSLRPTTQGNVQRQVQKDLEADADVVINTNRCSVEDVEIRVASHLGLFGRSYRRLVDVLVGGEYGSEGKGHIAAYLSSEYHVLVRVGGPNAGHTVYEDPPYTHHHLPSGTRCCPDARLVIGPGAVIYIPKLLKEIAACNVSRDGLSIDPQCMIISERDKAFEQRSLKNSIGSTAQGVGKASARRVLRGASQEPVRLTKDSEELKPYVRDTRQILDDAFFEDRRVLLEGTQGTGLSLYHGAFPYVTSRDTTVSGCLAEAGIAPSRVRKIVMVCRTYPIRVQSPDRNTSGPMGTEITWSEISRRSGIPAEKLRRTERTSTTNRRRRVAEFDWALLRKAASLNGPTDIALTFVDYISVKNQDARRYEQLTPETIRFIEEIERVAAAPVSLISTRFHERSIIDRRAW